MSDMKATRAPWISRGDSADWWLGTDAGPIITASYLGCVEVENPADMPLIKAAPKLYEALERIVTAGSWYLTALEIDECEQEEVYGYKPMDGEQLEAMALKALAEARGE